MKFEHLIEINDLLNPLIDRLTREQLWRGLELRAEAPEAFVPGMDRCRIVERNGNELVRELYFGKVVIRDRVSYEPQSGVRYLTEAPAELAGAALAMTIEEPQPEQLFVRFAYHHALDDRAGAHADFVDGFRRSAYTEADIDTIRIIRRYALEGRLNQRVSGGAAGA